MVWHSNYVNNVVLSLKLVVTFDVKVNTYKLKINLFRWRKDKKIKIETVTMHNLQVFPRNILAKCIFCIWVVLSFWSQLIKFVA